jgi:hypothetical protein
MMWHFYLRKCADKSMDKIIDSPKHNYCYLLKYFIKPCSAIFYFLVLPLKCEKDRNGALFCFAEQKKRECIA